MNVPEELKEYELEYAELVLYLPPDWKVNSSEEREYWPLRYMKVLGRLPVNADTWLGFVRRKIYDIYISSCDTAGFGDYLEQEYCG